MSAHQFLLFVATDYEAQGGATDFFGSYSSAAAAMAACPSLFKIGERGIAQEVSWGHVATMLDGRLVVVHELTRSASGAIEWSEPHPSHSTPLLPA